MTWLILAIVANVMAASVLGWLWWKQRPPRKRPIDRLKEITTIIGGFAVIIAGFVGLHFVGQCYVPYQSVPLESVPLRRVPERIETERNAALPVETLPDAPRRYAGKRQQEFAERWARVTKEAGPAPSPEAVPVVGYETASGERFPSRWRMAPDGDRANNLRATE